MALYSLRVIDVWNSLDNGIVSCKRNRAAHFVNGPSVTLVEENAKMVSVEEAPVSLTSNAAILTKALEQCAEQKKTPVTLLQEICQKKNIVPQYDLMSNQGVINAIESRETVFLYRVIVDDIVAVGGHKSKQKAKHAAAKNWLEKAFSSESASNYTLGGALSVLSTAESLILVRALMPELNLENDETRAKVEKEKVSTAVDEPKAESNRDAVSLLQELCFNRRWEKPEYNPVSAVGPGPGREPEFVMSCSLGNLMQTGTARKKQEAKKMAAQKVFDILTDAGSQDPNKPVPSDEDPFPTTPQMKELEAYFEQTKLQTERATVNDGGDLTVSEAAGKNDDNADDDDFSPTLATLLSGQIDLHETTPPAFVDVYTLNLISKSEGWSPPEFYFVPAKNKLGREQCLVQLQTSPVAVCYGTGESAEEARYRAARNALEYLKLMNTATTTPFSK